MEDRGAVQGHSLLCSIVKHRRLLNKGLKNGPQPWAGENWSPEYLVLPLSSSSCFLPSIHPVFCFLSSFFLFYVQCLCSLPSIALFSLPVFNFLPLFSMSFCHWFLWGVQLWEGAWKTFFPEFLIINPMCSYCRLIKLLWQDRTALCLLHSLLKPAKGSRQHASEKMPLLVHYYKKGQLNLYDSLTVNYPLVLVWAYCSTKLNPKISHFI